MKRLRVVGWNVQPIVMVDDGDNLTPLKIDPQMIPAAAWDEFKSGGDDASLTPLREQIEASSGAAAPVPIHEHGDAGGVDQPAADDHHAANRNGQNDVSHVG